MEWKGQNQKSWKGVPARAHLVPLRDLLELEGWCFQFASENDGSTQLKASNNQTAQCWTIRAASEDAALIELAGKTGWEMGN